MSLLVSGSGRVRQRVRVDRIPVRYLAQGFEATGHLENVSRAGLFVRAEELPAPETMVVLQFRPPTGALVEARGEVRWNTEGLRKPEMAPGFGVQLHQPSREYLEFFRWALGQAEEEKGDDEDAPAL
jgi:hypothetical protein